MEGFIDFVDFSRCPELLRLLYRFLREHSPAFLAGRLTATVNNIVKQTICAEPTFERFSEMWAPFFEEFIEPSTDESIDDNLRWAIASKILMKIFESCSVEYLV